MFWYYDPTIILLIPAFILALIAQAQVKSRFRRYSAIEGGKGITGAEAARRVLDSHGLRDVPVVRVSGSLTDHYDPRDRSVHLSDGVYGSDSVAAVGVACHECGHAIQHQESYKPLVIRDSIVPAVNIASSLSWILIMIGLALMVSVSSYTSGSIGRILFDIGIIAFLVVTFFHLITLPVEFNASRRGIREIETLQLVDADQVQGVKRVLRAAAMTYVAALAVAVANLLRVLLISRGGSRN